MSMRTRDAPIVPTDPDGEMVGDVHVVVEGDRSRPAVAMIHGIPGSVRDWRYLGPAVVDVGLCAVRIDMPGFGETPIAAFGSPKTANRAAFVLQTLRALGFARFAIVGHSIGGAVALHCAALFGDVVTAVAFVNSVGTRRHRGLHVPGSVIGLAARSLSVPALAPHAVAALERFYAARGTPAREPLDADVAGFHLEISAALDFSAQRLAARAVRCPALVVTAQNDPLVEPAVGVALARALVRAPLVTQIHVDDGGHALQKYQARRIAAWLGDRLH
jgi:pimeloyl-ACP methyl ester carboxylesterase